MTTSAAAERSENSSVRRTAVPTTTNPTSVANVVSIHTISSNAPTSGPTKYAAKPIAQRNISMPMTTRAPRFLVERAAMKPSVNVRTVAGAKNTISAHGSVSHGRARPRAAR
ncbi:MAG: hypothetical protein NT062_09525 [Proteobacteria bacterium]|nr:hypothetical protein [Pseudomonadota bacterium]